MENLPPAFGAWTRPGGTAATAAWDIDGLAFVIHPAMALADGERTG